MNTGEYDCLKCNERTRKTRNCRNKKKYKHKILIERQEWLSVSSHLRAVKKIAKIKFFECPQSAITKKTWNIIALVNEVTNKDTDILHLPFKGTILEQPEWFREAVKITKSERIKYQKEQLEKRNG